MSKLTDAMVNIKPVDEREKYFKKCGNLSTREVFHNQILVAIYPAGKN